MRISEKQIEAVSALPGPKRYSHFIKVVADTETAWGLFKDGWALVSTDSGETGFPLWPAEVYARRCAVGEWGGYEPEEIALEDLLSELLPMLEQDGVLPVIFMTSQSKGTTPTVEVLAADLRQELERY